MLASEAPFSRATRTPDETAVGAMGAAVAGAERSAVLWAADEEEPPHWSVACNQSPDERAGSRGGRAARLRTRKEIPPAAVPAE